MNGLHKVRILKVMALGVLLSSSAMAIAGQGGDRGYSNDRGHSYDRSYSSDRGHSNDRRYSSDRGHSNGKSNRRYGHQNKGHDGGKHHRKGHNKRYYAQPKRHHYRHSHNGRHGHIRHNPGYVTHYDNRVFLPRPPAVVLYPPRVGVYFGGRIDF